MQGGGTRKQLRIFHPETGGFHHRGIFPDGGEKEGVLIPVPFPGKGALQRRFNPGGIATAAELKDKLPARFQRPADAGEHGGMALFFDPMEDGVGKDNVHRFRQREIHCIPQDKLDIGVTFPGGRQKVGGSVQAHHLEAALPQPVGQRPVPAAEV